MEKYFVTKGILGYMVVHEEFDEKNGGNFYATDSGEFDFQKEAQEYADKLNAREQNK